MFKGNRYPEIDGYHGRRCLFLNFRTATSAVIPIKEIDCFEDADDCDRSGEIRNIAYLCPAEFSDPDYMKVQNSGVSDAELTNHITTIPAPPEPP